MVYGSCYQGCTHNFSQLLTSVSSQTFLTIVERYSKLVNMSKKIGVAQDFNGSRTIVLVFLNRLVLNAEDVTGHLWLPRSIHAAAHCLLTCAWHSACIQCPYWPLSRKTGQTSLPSSGLASPFVAAGMRKKAIFRSAINDQEAHQ